MEIKRKQLKQAVLLRQANHQALKQLLLAKKARLRSPQVQLHLKRPRRLLINLQQLQRHHKRHQNKDKVNQQVASQQTPAQAPSTQQAPQAQSNQLNYDPTTDRKLQDKQAEQNKRYKGVLTMVDSDFSAAAGNWKGENGETITVSSGGQFTVESSDGKKENYSIKGYSYTLDDGKYNAKIGGGKIIQITTGADGKVSSVTLSQ